MPKIFAIGEYVLLFWTGEDGEPVHIHIAVRRPVENSTKIWLTKSGGCILANNNSKIPEHDLRKLMKLVTFNHQLIVEKWAEVFGKDTVRFYL